MILQLSCSRYNAPSHWIAHDFCMRVLMQDIIESAHPEWHEILLAAFNVMAPDYLQQLQEKQDWLPGMRFLLAAFSRPLSSTRYILFGESPYPRAISANGYAFWDSSVGELWSMTGFSKEVNRATSLRNLMKMLLHARGDLNQNFSQAEIAQLDKSTYLQTATQLFQSFVNKGFLLLNASLVYSEDKVPYHARQWKPFMHRLLQQLANYNPALQLILFGRIATQIPETEFFPHLIAEHPYNISFITNPRVVSFFQPLDLLDNHEY
jgi:uracil-DNA glycosylase